MVIDGTSYVIDCFIGSGGTSEIYKCKSNSNQYAVKVLLPTENNKFSTKKLERFKREMKIQKESACEFIVPCLSEEFDSTEPKYLMPLYCGTLRDVIKNPNISRIDKLNLFLELCAALDYAHRRGIVHRDLKPENVMYDGNHVFLGDFGIAHFKESSLTTLKDRVANRDYCAPEQRIKGNDDIEPTTDIYALGLILNELFTGEIPFGHGFKHIADVYPPFGTLDSLVSSMTKHDPAERLDAINKVVVQINCILEEVTKKFARWKKITAIPNNINHTMGDKIVQIAFEDIQLAERMIQEGKIDHFTTNRNYHSNIRYDADALTDSIILLKVYERVKKRFEYEGAGLYNKGKYIGPPKDEKLKPGVYESFIEFISGLKLIKRNSCEYQNYENIRGLCVNYYQTIKHYELWKINLLIGKICEYTNEATHNAPILSIALAVSEMRKIHQSLGELDPFEFGILISIDWEHSTDKIEEDNLCKSFFKTAENLKVELEVRKELSNIYPRVVIIEEEGIYRLYFEKADFKDFRSRCYRLAKSKKLEPTDYLSLFDHVQRYEKYTVVGLYDTFLYSNLSRILGIGK